MLFKSKLLWGKKKGFHSNFWLKVMYSSIFSKGDLKGSLENCTPCHLLIWCSIKREVIWICFCPPILGQYDFVLFSAYNFELFLDWFYCFNWNWIHVANSLQTFLSHSLFFPLQSRSHVIWNAWGFGSYGNHIINWWVAGALLSTSTIRTYGHSMCSARMTFAHRDHKTKRTFTFDLAVRR